MSGIASNGDENLGVAMDHGLQDAIDPAGAMRPNMISPENSGYVTLMKPNFNSPIMQAFPQASAVFMQDGPTNAAVNAARDGKFAALPGVK
jgi:hypothetical protein